MALKGHIAGSAWYWSRGVHLFVCPLARSEIGDFANRKNTKSGPKEDVRWCTNRKLCFLYKHHFSPCGAIHNTKSLWWENSQTWCSEQCNTLVRSHDLEIEQDPRAGWLSSCLEKNKILWRRAHKWEMPGGQCCLCFWAALMWGTFLHWGV